MKIPKYIMKKIDDLDLDEGFFTCMAIKAMRIGLGVNGDEASLRFCNSESYLYMLENKCNGVSDNLLRKICSAIGVDQRHVLELSRFLVDNKSKLIESIRGSKDIHHALLPFYHQWRKLSKDENFESSLDTFNPVGVFQEKTITEKHGLPMQNIENRNRLNEARSVCGPRFGESPLNKNRVLSVEEMIPSPDRVRDMIKSKTKELALLKLLLKASEQAAKMDDSKD